MVGEVITDTVHNAIRLSLLNPKFDKLYLQWDGLHDEMKKKSFISLMSHPALPTGPLLSTLFTMSDHKGC